MDWGIITGVAGIFIGGCGLGLAVIANSQAKKSNELSQASNEIASHALNTALDANKIAESANKFSQEANTLLERQISQDTESHFVNWECDWDSEIAAITIKNLGRDTAHEVSVIVTADDFYEVSNWPVIEAKREGVSIPIDQFIENRILFNEKSVIRASKFQAKGFWISTGLYKRVFNVVITWKSSLGVPDKFITEVEAS